MITKEEMLVYCVSIREKPTYVICGGYQNGGGVLAWCMAKDHARVVADWYKANGGTNITMYTFPSIDHSTNTWKRVD